jgi:hypothetical protein
VFISYTCWWLGISALHIHDHSLLFTQQEGGYAHYKRLLN